MSELKPCPWCPEPPMVGQITDGRFEHNLAWAALCDNIDCPVQPMTDSCATRPEAIAAWNRRTSQPEEPINTKPLTAR